MRTTIVDGATLTQTDPLLSRDFDPVAPAIVPE